MHHISELETHIIHENLIEKIIFTNDKQHATITFSKYYALFGLPPELHKDIWFYLCNVDKDKINDILLDLNVYLRNRDASKLILNLKKCFPNVIWVNGLELSIYATFIRQSLPNFTVKDFEQNSQNWIKSIEGITPNCLNFITYGIKPTISFDFTWGYDNDYGQFSVTPLLWTTKVPRMKMVYAAFTHYSYHFDTEHYHICYSEKHVMYLLLDAALRTWRSAYRYNDGTFDLKQRITYAYRLVSGHNMNKDQIENVLKLQRLCLISPPFVPSKLGTMSVLDLYRWYKDKKHCVDTSHLRWNKVMVNDMQLEAIEKFGIHVMEEHVLHIKGHVLLEDDILEKELVDVYKYPNELPIDLNVLDYTNIQTITPFTKIRVDTEIQIRPNLDETFFYAPNDVLLSNNNDQANLRIYQRAKEMYVMSTRDDVLYDYFVQADTLINVESNLFKTILSIIFNDSKNISYTIESGERQYVKFDGIDGVLKKSLKYLPNPSLHSDMLISSLLDSLIKANNSVEESFTVSIINSPYQSVLAHKLWNSKLTLRHVSTGIRSYGTLYEPLTLRSQLSPTAVVIYINKFDPNRLTPSQLSEVLSQPQIKTGYLISIECFWRGELMEYLEALRETFKEFPFTGVIGHTLSYGGIYPGLSLFMLYTTNDEGDVISYFANAFNFPTEISDPTIFAFCRTGSLLDVDTIIRTKDLNEPTASVITPGTFIETIVDTPLIKDAVGLHLSLSRNVQVRDVSKGLESVYCVTSYTNKNRIEMTRRRGAYLSSNADITHLIKTNIPHPQSFSYSVEELISQTDHTICKIKLQEYNLSTIDFYDYGSSEFSGIHLTKGRYIMVDRNVIPTYEIPGVTSIQMDVSLDQPIPLHEGVVFMYNSIFFSSDMLPPRLTVDGVRLMMQDMFDEVDSPCIMFNLPIMNDYLATALVKWFTITYEPSDEGLGYFSLKLSTYPLVRCFSPAVIGVIITYFTEKGYDVELPLPTRADYLLQCSTANISILPSACNLAELLHLSLRLIIAKKRTDGRVITQLPSHLNIQCIEGDLFAKVNANTKNVIIHCISADGMMSKGFAATIRKIITTEKGIPKDSKIIPNLMTVGDVHQIDLKKFKIYNLITKQKYFSKPTVMSLRMSLEKMRNIIIEDDIKVINMPKIGSGLDKLPWDAVLDEIKRAFEGVAIQINVFTGVQKLT